MRTIFSGQRRSSRYGTCGTSPAMKPTAIGLGTSSTHSIHTQRLDCGLCCVIDTLRLFGHSAVLWFLLYVILPLELISKIHLWYFRWHLEDTHRLAMSRTRRTLVHGIKWSRFSSEKHWSICIWFSLQRTIWKNIRPRNLSSTRKHIRCRSIRTECVCHWCALHIWLSLDDPEGACRPHSVCLLINGTPNCFTVFTLLTDYTSCSEGFSSSPDSQAIWMKGHPSVPFERQRWPLNVGFSCEQLRNIYYLTRMMFFFCNKVLDYSVRLTLQSSQLWLQEISNEAHQKTTRSFEWLRSMLLFVIWFTVLFPSTQFD